jgi:predicted ATPase
MLMEQYDTHDRMLVAILTGALGAGSSMCMLGADRPSFRVARHDGTSRKAITRPKHGSTERPWLNVRIGESCW